MKLSDKSNWPPLPSPGSSTFWPNRCVQQATFPVWQNQNYTNGSLFNVFLATVKENNVENEMSGELPFSRLKMGDRKQGNP